MNDKTRILKWIEAHGSITSAEAFTGFGCARLASRIHDLKRDGYDIEKTMETGLDRFGDKTRYARYRLKGGENATRA